MNQLTLLGEQIIKMKDELLVSSPPPLPFQVFFPDYSLEQMLQLTTQASSSSFLIMCDVGRSHMMTHFLQMVN